MKKRKQIHGERSEMEVGRNFGRYSIIAIKNACLQKRSVVTWEIK